MQILKEETLNYQYQLSKNNKAILKYWVWLTDYCVTRENIFLSLMFPASLNTWPIMFAYKQCV